MDIPAWLKHDIQVSDLERIEQTVAKVETSTSAEIVPMIVRRSVALGHVPVILFLSCLLVLIFAVDSIFWSLLVNRLPAHFGPFAGASVEAIALTFLEAMAVLLAAFFAWIGKGNDRICRWLTSSDDSSSAVMQRAQLEFYQSQIKATEGRTGVLIFVSLLEHKAVVLADQAVSSKFPPETWEKVIADFLKQVRSENLAAGFCTAIENVGELLHQSFPVQPGDQNELRNHLIMKD